jgi:hypothetical protein
MRLRTVFRRRTSPKPRTIAVAPADDRSEDDHEFDRDMWYLADLRQAITTQAHSAAPRMGAARIRRILNGLETQRIDSELFYGDVAQPTVEVVIP